MPFTLTQFAAHSSRFVALSVLMLSLSSCKPPLKELPQEPQQADDAADSDATQPSVERLPVNRTIHDINGRALEVRIIARANTIVRMTRLEDNYKFDFPVTQLSEKDRKFVLQFPESILSPLTQSPAASSSEKKGSGEAAYIQTRTQAVERIIKDIHELTTVLRSIEPGTSKARTQQKKIDAKEMEILHLEGQIETYRQNAKPK